MHAKTWKRKREREKGASFPRSFMGRHSLKVILQKEKEKVKKGGLEYFLDSTSVCPFVQQRTFSSSLCKKKQFSARPPFPFQVLIFPAGVAVPAHPSNFSSFRAHFPFPALLLLLSRPPPKKITRYTPSWLSLLHTSTDSSRPTPLFLSSTYIPLPGKKTELRTLLLLLKQKRFCWPALHNSQGQA